MNTLYNITRVDRPPKMNNLPLCITGPLDGRPCNTRGTTVFVSRILLSVPRRWADNRIIIVRFVPVWFPTWFPGVSVLRHAAVVRKLNQEITNTPVKCIKEKKVDNLGLYSNVHSMNYNPYQAEKKAEECFVSSMLDVFEKLQTPDTEMEEDIKAIGMVAFTGEWINASLVDFLWCILCWLPQPRMILYVAIDQKPNKSKIEQRRLPLHCFRSSWIWSCTRI